MISVSNILGLGKAYGWVKSWPIFSIPGRVCSLEKRIQEMEERLNVPRSQNACPACGESTFFVVNSHYTGAQGSGMKRRTYKCKSCGFVESRDEKP
jgi:ribosomal protein S27AE